MTFEHIISIALVALVHSALISLFPRWIAIVRRAWRNRSRDY
jgi:hypothetical protein